MKNTLNLSLIKSTVAALFLILGVFAMEINAAEVNDNRDPRFSPDGKSLIFDRCSSDYPDWCRIHVYNFETGVLGYYSPPPGQTWTQAYFSDAGDKIVFVTMPAGNHTKEIFSQRNEIFPKAQIAIMNLDGSNMRVMTNMAGYKGMPAFSHSGKKVVFAQAEKIRDSGKTVAAHWDLWELDLETGVVGLFAGHFQFYQLGLSTYFPDDRRVLVNGVSPKSQIGGTPEEFSSRLAEYNRRYKYNAVFESFRGQATLTSPLFPDLAWTQRASMDALGNVFFIADGGPKEGLKIRRAGLNGQRSSWPFPLVSNYWGANVSRDGRYFVMSIAPEGEPKYTGKLALFDTATGVWKDIDLPQQAKQINR